MIGDRIDDVGGADPGERRDDRITDVRIRGIESLGQEPPALAERAVQLIERDGLRWWRGVEREDSSEPRARRVEKPRPLRIDRARVCLDGKGGTTLERIIGLHKAGKPGWRAESDQRVRQGRRVDVRTGVDRDRT